MQTVLVERSPKLKMKYLILIDWLKKLNRLKYWLNKKADYDTTLTLISKRIASNKIKQYTCEEIKWWHNVLHKTHKQTNKRSVASIKER